MMAWLSSHRLFFQVRNFGQAAAMALEAAESRGQKCLNQFPFEVFIYLRTNWGPRAG